MQGSAGKRKQDYLRKEKPKASTTPWLEYLQKQFRMLPTNLEELLGWIAPQIIKNSEKRQTIVLEERLCITLRYLVTGDAQVTTGSSYHISPTSMGRIITETTAVLWDVLHKLSYLKVTSTQ